MRAHAKSCTCFELAAGNGQNGTPKSFGHVGAVNEPKRQHAGGERIDVRCHIAAKRFQQIVQTNAATVKDQQHQHQIWNATDDGGVKGGDTDQWRFARKFGGSPSHTQNGGDYQRGQRHPHREQGAVKNGRVISAQKMARKITGMSDGHAPK